MWSWLQSLVYKLWELRVLKMGPHGPVLPFMAGVTLQQAQEYVRIYRQAQETVEAEVRRQLAAQAAPQPQETDHDARAAQLLRWRAQYGPGSYPGGRRPKPDG